MQHLGKAWAGWDDAMRGVLVGFLNRYADLDEPTRHALRAALAGIDADVTAVKQRRE